MCMNNFFPINFHAPNHAIIHVIMLIFSLELITIENSNKVENLHISLFRLLFGVKQQRNPS